MFVSEHWNNSPDGVYPQYKGVTSNPCGEIFMQEYDSCRLIHLNLSSFVSKPYSTEASFDFEKFYRIAYYALYLGDLMIDLEALAIDNIINHIKSSNGNNESEVELWEKIKNTALSGRRAGVGFTGLGDVFAMMNLPYGSDNSISLLDEIMRTKQSAELDCTIDMSILKGPFKGWDNSLEYDEDGNGKNQFFKHLALNFPEQLDRMQKYGRRNISFSTVAPTGTVSILTQTSSGIEPIFKVYYERKVKCNKPSDRVDFIDDNGDKFTIYKTWHLPFKMWVESNYGLVDNLNYKDIRKIYSQSPWCKSEADEINYIDRIRLQSCVQMYTTHSISSTINLPESTTEDTISEIYKLAWKHRLKGVTVYRDGSRYGILNDVNKQKDTDGIIEYSAPKRPKVLEADLHVVTVKGVRYAVIVGLLKNKPFEVFAFEFNPVFLRDIKTTKGTITKVKKGEYRFDSEVAKFSNLHLSNSKIEEKACTMYASMLLRHGAEIQHIIKTSLKVNENIGSFTSAMCRVLSKYIAKEEVKGEVCPECGGKLLREAGCTKCENCGHSHCMLVTTKY